MLCRASKDNWKGRPLLQSLISHIHGVPSLRCDLYVIVISGPTKTVSFTQQCQQCTTLLIDSSRIVMRLGWVAAFKQRFPMYVECRALCSRTRSACLQSSFFPYRVPTIDYSDCVVKRWHNKFDTHTNSWGARTWWTSPEPSQELFGHPFHLFTAFASHLIEHSKKYKSCPHSCLFVHVATRNCLAMFHW